MKENLKIAWRNLWRNKRRTLITISSIFFAVFFAIIMRSFQIGTYEHMLNNMITQFSGHLQVQDKEYFDNPSIDNAIPYNDSIKNNLNNIPEITFYVPRIQTGGLTTSGNISRLSIIMGVDYENENKLSNLDKRIVRYYLDSSFVNSFANQIPEKSREKFLKYQNRAFTNRDDLAKDLQADGIDTNKFLKTICEQSELKFENFSESKDEIYIGYKLAQYFEAKIGDSLIIIGQGYHGSSAIGKYKIAGLIKFPTDALNERIIYMPLRTCQMFMGAYDVNENNDSTFYVNYISVNTKFSASLNDKDYEKILDVKTKIESNIQNEWITVVGWKNLNKELIEGITLDNAQGKIMLFVLYLIISFGVLGTVMMMIAERKREFGVLMAIGMRRRKLSMIVALEMFFMGMIAAISGIIITAPIIFLGHNYPIKIRGEMGQGFGEFNIEPILPLAWFDTYIWSQIIIVIVIVVFVLVYALFKIRKMKVIEALRA